MTRPRCGDSVIGTNGRLYEVAELEGDMVRLRDPRRGRGNICRAVGMSLLEHIETDYDHATFQEMTR